MKALQVGIIKRFMSEENYRMFLQDYKDARKIQRRESELTEDDYAIYDEFKGGKSIEEIMAGHAWSRSRVVTAIVSVSKKKIF